MGSFLTQEALTHHGPSPWKAVVLSGSDAVGGALVSAGKPAVTALVATLAGSPHPNVGAGAALDRKALKLTGGPDSAKAPAGRNQYAWVMESGQADVFLTYCTNAVLARKEAASLKSVALPPELSVGADYGLIVLKDAPPEASRLALFILSPDGQAILASYGFDAPTGQ